MCTRVLPRCAWLATSVWLVPALAHAQSESSDPPRPVIVVVDDSAASVTPPAPTREAISQELHAPVLAPGETAAVSARGTLTLAVDPEHRLVIAYRDAEGHEVFRAIAVPGDPVAAVATVALIAGNLARNDADALLAAMRSLQPPPVVQPPPFVPPPSPTLLAPPRMVLVEPAENRAMAHPFSLGAEGYFSGVAVDSQNTDVIAVSGLAFSYAFASHFALGVSHLNFGDVSIATGNRFALSAGPFVEAFGFLTSWFQLFGQAGLPIERRWGANLGATTGLAPFVGGGVRFWLGDYVTVGLGVRGYAAAGDGYLFTEHVLPAGAIVLSGGCDLAVHL